MGAEDFAAGSEVTLSVSDFVELLNQSLEYVFPTVTVIGELANFRVSKNRWVYFDLKDDYSSVKCFGTVYQLSGSLEDGMVLQVQAQPKLHNLYGFSLNVVSMRPSGEGTIKRAAQLLQAKLQSEGLFAVERKRGLPYPPERIGLITSSESAAYADFMKILQARWGGIAIELIDVQVQGDIAPVQIVSAVEQFNAQALPPDVLVITRGGGSAEDLQAFSTEQVTRAVAGSRVPTLVAIGHENDISLAELAADQRASTPSNAAELLTPDRRMVVVQLQDTRLRLLQALQASLSAEKTILAQSVQALALAAQQCIRGEQQVLVSRRQLLQVLNPSAILRRGYAIVRQDNRVLRSIKSLKKDATITVVLSDGSFTANVEKGNS